MSQRNIFLFLLVVVTGLISCGKPSAPPPWETYTSKDHLYKISYPHDWQGTLNGSTYTISPLDTTGSVAVSAYIEKGDKFDQPAFQDMVMRDFSECRVKEPFKSVKLGNWEGEDAVYEQMVNGNRVTWLFRIAHHGQVGVFVAANEIEAHLKPRLPTYKKIMDSLVVLEPLPEGSFEKKVKQFWQEIVIKWLRSTEDKNEKPKEQ
jgi:hypothetical protein